MDLADRLGDLALGAHARTRVFWTNLERGDALAADFSLMSLEEVVAVLLMPSHSLAALMARCIREAMQGHLAEAQAKLDEIEATRDRWSNALGTTWLVDPGDMMRIHLGLLRGDVPTFPRGAPPAIQGLLSLFFVARCGTLGSEERDRFERIVGLLLQGEVLYMTRIFLGEVCAKLRATEHARTFYELCLPFEGRHIVWTPMPGYDGSIDRLLSSLADVMGERTKALRHYDAGISMEEHLRATPFAERSRKERATMAPTSVRVPATISSAPSFVREGEVWLASFGSETTRLKDADGLRYLAYLVSRPRVPVPVVELFAERANATGDAAPVSGDAGTFPKLRIVGIDPLPAALLEARANVAAHGLQDRIELRSQRGDELTEVNHFDSAFVPSKFFDDASFQAALHTLAKALKKDGAILTGAWRDVGEPRAAAISKLRCEMWGAGPRTTEEVTAMLNAAGFKSIRLAPSQGAMVPIVAKR